MRATGLPAIGVAGQDVVPDPALAPVRPALVGWDVDWAAAEPFDVDRAAAVVAADALPMLTWQPWAPAGGADQPDFAPARIASGEHDDYLRWFARQIREWGGPLVLRFAPAPDAGDRPWAVGVGATTAADVVAAWRHVHRVVSFERADVVWTWSVDAAAGGAEHHTALHPGDDVVDWWAVDGTRSGGGHPIRLFSTTIARLRAVADRPVLAVVAAGGDEPGRVGELLDWAAHERLSGVVWAGATSGAEADALAAAAGRRSPLPLPARPYQY